MRRLFPLSAILAGILVTPGLARTPAVVAPQVVSTPASDPDVAVLGSEVLQVGTTDAGQGLSTAALPALRDQLEQFMRGRRLDAFGMQELQRHMASDMQNHLNHVLTDVARVGSPGPLIQVTPGQVAVRTAETEKAAYLGVSASAVTPAIREQLKLPRGVGLAVDFVEKDSPASVAGLKLYDVLQKLDDQILVNPQQFAVLVRMKKPGDSVALTVIHGGQPLTLSAKLIEKELPVLGDAESNPSFSPAPQLYLQPGNTTPFNDNSHQPWPWQQNSHITVTAGPDGSKVQTLIDDQNDITLTTKDGKAAVVAKDRTGKTLYEGPYTTAEDKAKVPADLAGKIQSLERNSSRVTIRQGPNELRAESATLSRNDADHLITLRIDGSGRSLTIKDLKSNQTIFDGPANTDADLKALPADLLAKVKALAGKADSMTLEGKAELRK